MRPRSDRFFLQQNRVLSCILCDMAPSTMRCPHCLAEIDLPDHGPHSTSARVDDPQALRWRDNGYRPNPTKAYRSSEKDRRTSLARYYANRDAILAARKAERAALRAERDARRATLWGGRLQSGPE